MATLYVTNNSGSASTPGSLPFEVANAVSGDTIVFAPADFPAGNAAADTIDLTSTLVISTNITIDADANNTLPPQITLDGGGAVTDLEITGGANVTLTGLTIADGHGQGTNGANGIARGVGSETEGVSGGNTAGGIYIANGSLTINDSVLSNDTATGGNGGNGAYGALKTAGGGGAGGNAGGAIYVGPAGTLTLGSYSGVSYIGFKDDSSIGGNGGAGSANTSGNGGVGGMGGTDRLGGAGQPGNSTVGPPGAGGMPGQSGGSSVTGSGGGGGGGNSFADVSGTGTINEAPGTITEPPCFCRGTLILTPSGEVPVEDLAVGDAVTTLSGAEKPIAWIGHGRSLITTTNERARPIVVRRGAFADGVPCRDLYVTKGHSFYLDGVLIPVEYLVNGRSVLWDEGARVVEFYHVELWEHDVLVADGAPAESYKEDGNRDRFHNSNRPAVAATESDWFASVVSGGPVVAVVWRRLLDRSGFVPPALTAEPDLHLVADGVRIDAASVEDGVYRFRLERPPTLLRIASRSAVPLAIGRNHDKRRLGVAIRSIALGGDGVATVLSHDSPWLADGFHDSEPEPGFRWTNGDASVPSRALRAFDGSFELTLDVADTVEYPIADADTACVHEAA